MDTLIYLLRQMGDVETEIDSAKSAKNILDKSEILG